MRLVSKGITIFGNYRTELYQKSNGQFAVWIIPINREASDNELPRYEPVTDKDWIYWTEAHKQRPA